MKPRTETREQIDRAFTFLRRSLSFWQRGLVAFLLGLCVVVPYVLTRPPAYRSETVILYQETMRSMDLTGGEASGESARRVGARLREVLLSRASLEPIAADLRLYAKVGQVIDRAAQVESVDEMRKHVTFRAREGDAFEIAFVGSTPSEAQEVTRRLGECIIQEAATRRAEHAKALKEFLAAENETNKSDLQQKEADLAKFTALHPALAARLQGAPVQPGSVVGPVASTLEARAYRLERQLRAASNKPPPAAPPRFRPPPDSADLVSARKALADKLAHYTDRHPDVNDARAHVRAAEAAQAAVNAEAYEAFKAEQAAALTALPPKDATEEAELRRQLAHVNAEIWARNHPRAARDVAAAPSPSTSPEVALEVEFRRLQREVGEGRERQHQLDEKLFKASITANSVMNDRNIQVSVLDPAFLPSTPVSKPRSLLLGGLLALCLLLAIAIAIASAVADDRVYDRFDIERLDLMPVVGVILRPQLPARR